MRVTVVELPYPPSINTYWRHVGTRTIISRRGRAFRETVCSILAAAGVVPLVGPLIVEIAIFPPDRRRRDVDNVLKSLLDALQHGRAYLDDSQIVRLTIERRNVIDGGRSLVSIRVQ